MANEMTKIADLIDPEVMADMINAKLPQKIKITPYAKIDTTLVGQPGDGITVPKYSYIGDTEDVAEGVAMGTTKLATSSTKTKVKKAGKAVTITDEAVLSGYGNPVGEATNQLAMSVASKAVSYTHLDVYKRQLKEVREDAVKSEAENLHSTSES